MSKKCLLKSLQKPPDQYKQNHLFFWGGGGGGVGATITMHMHFVMNLSTTEVCCTRLKGMEVRTKMQFFFLQFLLASLNVCEGTSPKLLNDVPRVNIFQYGMGGLGWLKVFFLKKKKKKKKKALLMSLSGCLYNHSCVLYV